MQQTVIWPPLESLNLIDVRLFFLVCKYLSTQTCWSVFCLCQAKECIIWTFVTHLCLVCCKRKPAVFCDNAACSSCLDWLNTSSVSWTCLFCVREGFFVKKKKNWLRKQNSSTFCQFLLCLSKPQWFLACWPRMELTQCIQQLQLLEVNHKVAEVFDRTCHCVLQLLLVFVVLPFCYTQPSRPNRHFFSLDI